MSIRLQKRTQSQAALEHSASGSLIWSCVFIVCLILGCATPRIQVPEQPASESFEEKSESKKTIKRETRKMLVTAYDPGQKSCSWKYKHGLTVYANGPLAGKVKRVGITANGTRAKKGVIAADISRYPYGTRMYVPGYGWGEVHDIGSAIKGDHIDVFYASEKEALRWGRKNLVVKVIYPDTASAEYRRKKALHLALREDLRKKLAALAEKKNLKERDLVAEAVEDLLKKYEAEEKADESLWNRWF